jgi:hypothetical protein
MTSILVGSTSRHCLYTTCPKKIPNGVVSTRSHLWIAAEVSPVPISLYVTMNKLTEVKWVQTQENIALTLKSEPDNA